MFTTLHTFKTRNIHVEQFRSQDLYFFFPGQIKSSFATVVQNLDVYSPYDMHRSCIVTKLHRLHYRTTSAHMNAYGAI